MSNRTQKLARLIGTTFPQLSTRQLDYGIRTNPIDCTRGPVVSICDGGPHGIAIAIHGLDCDNIPKICADLTEQVLSDGIDLGEEDGFEKTLCLSIQRHTPIFDDADWCVGEVIECTAVEHSQPVVAIAA